MTQHLSEQMPVVARGAASWTDDQRAHLAACADCSGEWSLVQAAAGLGRDVVVDSQAVARGLSDRMAAEPARVLRLRRVRWWTGLAAAAALITAVVLVKPWSSEPTLVVEMADVLLPELEGLNAEELENVFDVLPAVATRSDIPMVPGVDDLTDDELESVLRTLEG